MKLWFGRRRRDEELEEEIRAHLEMAVRDRIERGETPEEARHAARREFGNEGLVRETTREMWGWGWLERLFTDIRYGMRMLRKAPGFVAAAVLILALGIGANTAIFSVTYGILFKPLPYPGPSHLVQLRYNGIFAVRRDFFRDIAPQTRSMVRWGEYLEGGGTIVGPGSPDGVSISYVSGDFFSVLGARPLLGRPILPADAKPGHDHVAVLSYALWRNRFGGDSHIVGKEIEIDDQSDGIGKGDGAGLYTIVGVMPQRLSFPDRDLYLSQGSWSGQIQVIGIGRLRDGATLSTANAALRAISQRLHAGNPKGRKEPVYSVELLRDRLTEGYGTELLVLLGAATFVLLLACVNASGLLVARSWTRQKEVAIRETLGATRLRLVRQFLAEGALLSVAGGAVGLVLAYWGVHLLRAMAPPGTPRLDEISVNWVVFGYTAGISALTAILFAVAPALQLTRQGPGQAVNERRRVSFAGLHSHRPWRLKNLLPVGEIALAFVLVIGSALTLHSFWNLVHVQLGFRPTHLLTMYVEFSRGDTRNPKIWKPEMDEVLRRTRALPGVEDAAFGEWIPIGGTPFASGVGTEATAVNKSAMIQKVSPGYFATFGIRLLRGRSFNEEDKEGSPPVAVVNEAFAKRYMNGDPMGRQFYYRGIAPEPVRVEVVGEVGNPRDWALQHATSPEFFVPFGQQKTGGETSLFVRTAADPMAMAKAVRKQVAAVDPNAPVGSVRSMDTLLSEATAPWRFLALLLGTFGGLALVLAAAGVYGLISYGVTRRTHEFGVRMALGAQRADVLGMILREGMVLAVVGIVLGIGGALAVTRVLRSMLFEITPNDPTTFVGVTILLGLAALAACWIPARRAMKVDPVEALREE